MQSSQALHKHPAPQPPTTTSDKTGAVWSPRPNRSWLALVTALFVLFLLASAQHCSAAPVDATSKTDLPTALSRHTRGSTDKGCGITSSEIALPLTFTIEMPSYVMIGNHKFNLKLQMPLVTKP